MSNNGEESTNFSHLAINNPSVIFMLDGKNRENYKRAPNNAN